jgi:hypothetical protein
MTLSINDTQQNNTLNQKYHYAEYHYAKCRVLFIVTLNVVLLNDVMLNVVAPSEQYTLRTWDRIHKTYFSLWLMKVTVLYYTRLERFVRDKHSS